MKRDLSGKLALDTGVLIELLFSTPTGLKLKEALKAGLVEAYITEFSIVELRYILCRRLGLIESDERVDKLLASGYISIEDTLHLIKDASRYKCERAISLADCFCLALAHKSSCSALFPRREKDLVKEMQRKPFDVEILFLEDYE
jgi:predicted nucleic acid-binding protein